MCIQLTKHRFENILLFALVYFRQFMEENKLFSGFQLLCIYYDATSFSGLDLLHFLVNELLFMHHSLLTFWHSILC